MGRDQVVERVVGMAGPRDEVVDGGVTADRLPAVEASPGLRVDERSPDSVEADPAGTEQELVELVGVHDRRVLRRDEARPAGLQHRPQQGAQPDETLRYTRTEADLVIERTSEDLTERYLVSP